MLQDWVEPSQRNADVSSNYRYHRANKTQLTSPTANRESNVLDLDERTILRVARKQAGNLAFVFVRQAVYELLISNWKRIRFRLKHNGAACRAYCEMKPDDFEAINARQSWANWRTIPRNLTGWLSNRPIKAVDLCCGIGQSTEVLAYYAAPGSEILGLEYNPQFVALARNRHYGNGHGPARVSFNAQSVLDTFRDEAGQAVADSSVDLVNSCGAVGCHFDPQATAALAKEIARVLKPGGLATIDSGSAGTNEADLVRIFTSAGFERLTQAKSCRFDRYTQVCFRKK